MRTLILTIKSSEEVWKSPDGQRSIWEVKDSEGNTWQTMSRQIAMAINQSMELTTRVSDKGKTYLIKPPQDDIQAPQGSQLRQGTPVGIVSPQLIERLTSVLERLERLLSADVNEPGIAEITDTDDLPPVSLYDRDMGEEIIDDI
jgi:hypothetical protein